MKNEFWLERYFHILEKNAQGVLFHIVKKDWAPSYDNLEDYCKNLCKEIVLKYKELEKTQEYVFTKEVLYARGLVSDELLTMCAGEGFTYSEISATHAIEWALVKLLGKFKVNVQPIDFKFISIGYKRPGYKENLPVLENVVNS